MFNHFLLPQFCRCRYYTQFWLGSTCLVTDLFWMKWILPLCDWRKYYPSKHLLRILKSTSNLSSYWNLSPFASISIIFFILFSLVSCFFAVWRRNPIEKRLVLLRPLKNAAAFLFLLSSFRKSPLTGASVPQDHLCLFKSASLRLVQHLIFFSPH